MFIGLCLHSLSYFVSVDEMSGGVCLVERQGRGAGCEIAASQEVLEAEGRFFKYFAEVGSSSLFLLTIYSFINIYIYIYQATPDLVTPSHSHPSGLIIAAKGT